jgi:hypothetical protein
MPQKKTVSIIGIGLHNTFWFDFDCDACGCSASGGSMGFSSMLNSNFIGIRYFNQQYKTTDGLYSNSPWYRESYNTTQLWARIPVYKNIQVIGFGTLPPQLARNRNRRPIDFGFGRYHGFGHVPAFPDASRQHFWRIPGKWAAV